MWFFHKKVADGVVEGVSKEIDAALESKELRWKEQIENTLRFAQALHPIGAERWVTDRPVVVLRHYVEVPNKAFAVVGSLSSFGFFRFEISIEGLRCMKSDRVLVATNYPESSFKDRCLAIRNAKSQVNAGRLAATLYLDVCCYYEGVKKEEDI